MASGRKSDGELERAHRRVSPERAELERRMLAERDRLITELEARNAELASFTSRVSHDLKTPLITILGFLGLLRRDADAGDAERMQQDIERIQFAANKMYRLLDDLLELSRIGRMVHSPQVIATRELAAETTRLVAGPIAARGVEVVIAPDLPMVAGDPGRLQQVFQNLLTNAVKYMGDQSSPRIEIGSRAAAAEALLYVRDNGIGIDARYHDKIFGLFDRLDASAEGTGIGLALVRRIVEVHGGRIWVESAGLGHGSTFCFTLPLLP